MPSDLEANLREFIRRLRTADDDLRVMARELQALRGELVPSSLLKLQPSATPACNAVVQITVRGCGSILAPSASVTDGSVTATTGSNGVATLTLPDASPRTFTITHPSGQLATATLALTPVCGQTTTGTVAMTAAAPYVCGITVVKNSDGSLASYAGWPQTLNATDSRYGALTLAWQTPSGISGDTWQYGGFLGTKVVSGVTRYWYQTGQTTGPTNFVGGGTNLSTGTVFQAINATPGNTSWPLNLVFTDSVGNSLTITS